MKRGFILPLVLLILALMSGIAVVLGRLSSEKTLSLKNQEGSYYAKEITVALVDEEETDDSSEGTSSETGSYDFTPNIIGRKKSKIRTVGINKTDISLADKIYDVKIEIEEVDKLEILKVTIESKNTVTLDEVSKDNTYTGSNLKIDSDGTFFVQIQYIYITDKNNEEKKIYVTVTLTKQ